MNYIWVSDSYQTQNITINHIKTTKTDKKKKLKKMDQDWWEMRWSSPMLKICCKAYWATTNKEKWLIKRKKTKLIESVLTEDEAADQSVTNVHVGGSDGLKMSLFFTGKPGTLLFFKSWSSSSKPCTLNSPPLYNVFFIPLSANLWMTTVCLHCWKIVQPPLAEVCKIDDWIKEG